MKTKVIALANQKGDVGKTTTAVNLGIGLAKQGNRVLLIDADSQGSLTDALGWHNPDGIEITLANMLHKEIARQPIDPQEGILHHEEGVDLLPSNIELSAMEMTLMSSIFREAHLREYLKSVKKNYDYILIDCSPSLGLVTLNALTAADSVIIPVQAHYLPTKGMHQLLQTVQRIKQSINQSLRIGGILLTMVDNRTNLAKDVSAMIRESYGSKILVFDTEIPTAIAAAEAGAVGKSIYAFDPNNKVAKAYAELTGEVIAHEREIENRIKAAECR